MATAPTAVWAFWYLVEKLYNGPGLQDEELAGIVHGPHDTPGFHWSFNELMSSGNAGNYSLSTVRDRRGGKANPDDASAIDLHFGPAGMITVTKRLIAAAKAGHPAMACIYEFCGTTNGRTPHPFTVDTDTDDPNNTQGWDPSHVTHVHLSFHRDVCTDFGAIKGLAYVIAGVAYQSDPLEETLSYYLSRADFEAALAKIIDARVDAKVDDIVSGVWAHPMTSQNNGKRYSAEDVLTSTNRYGYLTAQATSPVPAVPSRPRPTPAGSSSS